MNIKHVLANLNAYQFRSIKSINCDINDEIEFHIHCRADELVADGLTKQTALSTAAAEFGSVGRIKRQCQQINYGSRVWLSRGAICTLILAVATIVWLAGQLNSLRQENLVLNKKYGATQRTHADWSNLNGNVIDQQGEPLPNTNILVVIKTWPTGGGYSQIPYTTETDRDGNYVIEKIVPRRGGFAVQIAAVRRGYSFEANYEERQQTSDSDYSPVNFRLQKAQSVIGVVLDSDRNPIPGATVYPSGRLTHNKQRFVYGDSAGPIHLTTDENGKVQLDYFAVGDNAMVSMKHPDGASWQTLDFKIETTSETVELIASK